MAFKTTWLSNYWINIGDDHEDDSADGSDGSDFDALSDVEDQ